MSDLETRSRDFTRDCGRCSLGTFRRGSHGRRGKCERSNGREHLGRCDGRDRSIMTARRCCRSVFCENRGVVQVGGCFAGARVRVGESFADTTGPALKVKGCACPL
jgi:hypothetical protein